MMAACNAPPASSSGTLVAPSKNRACCLPKRPSQPALHPQKKPGWRQRQEVGGGALLRAAAAGGEVLDVEQASSSEVDAIMPPLDSDARFSYKMLKAQPTDALLNELRSRRLPTWGRKDQLVSRVYSVFTDEGRALNSEESAIADAALGLTDSTTAAGWDSALSSDEEGEMQSSAALQRNPLLAMQSSISGQFLTHHNQERLLSNATNLQLSFLWGGTAANGIKHATSCLVRTIKSVWLFECGEDTQRHLNRSIISWAKLERIFISSLSVDNILGLPGFLCTISAAREKGHEAADAPVHVYGPQGLADYINTMLSVSRTYLEMPVIIHEFSAAAVPPEELEVLKQINPRSRLYVVRVPPDQLNPEGYYDAEIRTLLARHTRKRSNSGIDLRAGVMPQPLPPPGDPRRTGLRVADLTWSLRMDHEWVVRVAPLRNRQPTFGYMLLEGDRSGRLDASRAIELGVEPGPNFTSLKLGESVELPDGRVVHSADVLGPVRRGRRVAIIAACLDSSTFATSMASSAAELNNHSLPESCDLVVHRMGYPAGEAAAEGSDAPCSTAAMAGATAAVLGAQDLVLWQQAAGFLDLPQAVDESFPEEAIRAAQATLGSDGVSLAGSYWCHEPVRPA